MIFIISYVILAVKGDDEMKSGEVLRTLHITRQTLCKYVKAGKIRVTKLPNGMYDYDEASVYGFLNKDVARKTYLYARVSTQKQKADLENQISMLKQFCFMNGYQVSGIFSDIASSICSDDRKDFFRMLDEVVEGKVERVVITYKDRLSRVGFDLFKHLFAHYHCQIVIMSEVGSEKLDSEEMFDDIMGLLHCYSMELYSKKRAQKIREALSDEEG